MRIRTTGIVHNELNKQGSVLVFTTKWLESIDGDFGKTEVYAVSNKKSIVASDSKISNK